MATDGSIETTRLRRVAGTTARSPDRDRRLTERGGSGASCDGVLLVRSPLVRLLQCVVDRGVARRRRVRDPLPHRRVHAVGLGDGTAASTLLRLHRRTTGGTWRQSPLPLSPHTSGLFQTFRSLQVTDVSLKTPKVFPLTQVSPQSFPVRAVDWQPCIRC